MPQNRQKLIQNILTNIGELCTTRSFNNAEETPDDHRCKRRYSIKHLTLPSCRKTKSKTIEKNGLYLYDQD